MPATTMLLTLFLVGVSGDSPHGEGGLPDQGQTRDLSSRAPEATETTGGKEGGNVSTAHRDSSSALPRRAANGERTWGPVVRGALIGTVLGGILGLLGGAAAGAVLAGVIRAVP